MIVFAETLRALSPLFFLILTGAALKRTGIIRSDYIPIMNSLVVNVTLPALVIQKLAPASPIAKEILWLPFVCIASEFVTLLAAFALGKALRMQPVRLGALLMVSAYGNTGFLGYPITIALLPHMLTAAVLIDQIGMSIILYPSAPIIGSFFGAPQKDQPQQPGKEVPASQHVSHTKVMKSAGPVHAKRFKPSERTRSALKFFKSPLFIAMCIGGLVHIIPWPHAITHSASLKPLGKVVMDCLGLLGQGTIPLIMLSMGASLKSRSAQKALSPILLASCLKLLLAPLAMLIFLRGLGVTGEILAVGVLQAGMPTSVMSSVLTKYHDMDGDFAVGVVFITTVLSALTIPMWITLIGH